MSNPAHITDPHELRPPKAGWVAPKPVPPPPTNATREVFTAFARGDTRKELMDAMRAQAEGYFGCKVSLRDAAIQPAPHFGAHSYQATSRWVAQPPKPTPREK